MNKVTTALMYATAKHSGQFRKYTNEPYINHPIRVWAIFRETFGASEDYESIALLHDVMEDCYVKRESLYDIFGCIITDGVEGLTNPSKKYPTLSRHERKQMDVEHIAKLPPYLKWIKLCDRFDNIRDMHELVSKPLSNSDFNIRNIRTLQFFKEYAQETKNLITTALTGYDQELEEEILRCAYDLNQIKVSANANLS